MGASRRIVALAAAAACALAACDALLGLDKYQDVACAFDCGVDAAETGPRPDAPDVMSLPDVYEAAADASDASDAGDAADVLDSDVVVTPEGGWPVPTGHEVWAHWPMPNPDAAIAPEASTLLPHPMAYDAGIDASSPVAHDTVTGLSWLREPFPSPVMSLGDAWSLCTGQPGGPWRVPTRIELVSLIDFTVPSGQMMIDRSTFPFTQPGPYWTSSPVPGDDGPAGYWTVAFNTGLASNSGPGLWVMCVKGGTP
jgi:hypothetical protein